jgi:hypothetical protein
MPSSPVSISNDLTMTMGMIPLITPHEALGVPPAVLPPFLPHLEMPVTMMWPPGFALMQNKLTTTVIHKMLPIVLDGHDCGYMIIHVPIPPAPPNVKVVLHIAFSSRKIAFAASKVKANGTPIACTSIWFPIPMMVCANPITMPLGTAPFNLLNSVQVGMTWTDVLFGVISIAVTMAIDFFSWDPAGPISLGSATDWAWKATLGDSPKMWAIKAGAGLAVNAARLFIADGDGSLSLSVGPGGYWGASAGFSRSDGVWSFSASASAGTASPVGPSVGGQKSWQHTWNKDGSTTTTSSSTAASGAPIGPGGVAAQQTSSTSTTKDAAGKDTSTSESKTTQVVAGEPFVGGSRVSSESTTTPTGGTPQKSSSGHQGGNAFGNTWGETL